MTGLGLGATVSVKWVGLFTIAWVGSLTVLQLWVLLGDAKTVTPVSFGIHCSSRENANYFSVSSPSMFLLEYSALSLFR